MSACLAPRPAAVLLDVFGTLIAAKVDYQPYSDMMLAMALDRGEVTRAERMLMTSHVPTVREAGAVLRKMFPARHLPESAVRRAEADHTAHVSGMALRPGVPGALQVLRDAGFRLALVSNLSTPYKAPITVLGIDRWVTTHVFSCDVGWLKPDREIFEAALALTGSIPGETVMIGDNPIDDLLGARGAGIRGLLVGDDDPDDPAAIDRLAARLAAERDGLLAES